MGIKYRCKSSPSVALDGFNACAWRERLREDDRDADDSRTDFVR